MRPRHLYLSGVAIAVLALAAGSASAQLVTIGGDDGSLVTIGGGDGDGGIVGGGTGDGGLDLDLLGDDTDADVTANVLDGDPNGDPDATVDFGGSGNDPDVLLDLFGANSRVASANAGVEDDSDAEVLVGGGGASGSDVEVSLFGSDSGSDGSDVELDLFGDGVDDTETGSINDPQQPPAGGTGIGTGAGNNSNATRIAAVGRTGVPSDCFTPDEDQIDHLLARNSYSASVAADWADASSVSVVPVELCPDARARVAAAVDADANIGFMQARAASSPRIRTALDPAYGPEDVLAIDQAGDRLTVYVF